MQTPPLHASAKLATVMSGVTRVSVALGGVAEKSGLSS